MRRQNDVLAKCAILAAVMMAQFTLAFAQDEMPSGPLTLHGAVQPTARNLQKTSHRIGRVNTEKLTAKPAEILRPAPRMPSLSATAAAVVPIKAIERGAKAPNSPEQAKPGKTEAPVATISSSLEVKAAQTFCAAVADRATEVRNAWQAQKIADLEVRLKERIDELDARRKDYQQWVARQDEARKKAEDGVVAIFAKMRPDAAASQLSAMDDAVAAAVLSKLSARTASVILNEITPTKAARITDAIGGGVKDMK